MDILDKVQRNLNALKGILGFYGETSTLNYSYVRHLQGRYHSFNVWLILREAPMWYGFKSIEDMFEKPDIRISSIVDRISAYDREAGEALRDRVWIAKLPLSDVSAVKVPETFKNITKVNIYLTKPFIDDFTDNELGSVLLHEAYHIVFDKNPARFGLRPEDIIVFKLLNLEEGVIDREVAKSPFNSGSLASERMKTGTKFERIYHEWVRKEVPIPWLGIGEIILRYHTLLTGKPL